MPLHEITVSLLRAEGVKVTLGYHGELKGWITDFSIRKITFPEESTQGAYDLFKKFQECAEANHYIWNSINSSTLLIEIVIGNGLAVGMFGSLEHDALAPGTAIGLYPNSRGGMISEPSIWEDEVETVST